MSYIEATKLQALMKAHTDGLILGLRIAAKIAETFGEGKSATAIRAVADQKGGTVSVTSTPVGWSN